MARGDCRRHADSRNSKAKSLKPEVCTTPLPTPVQGWVASAYILSCAPLLVRGERATQWRGGGLPKARQKPSADSRQPEAGSLHYALAHPCPGVGGERLYTLLRPTACQGGEGHAVARGDCRRHAESRKPGAESRKPAAGSRQPIAVKPSADHSYIFL